MSPLKIKIPSKNMYEKLKIHQLFIKVINYVWYLLHISALHCHLQGVFLVPSERSEIATHHVTRHSTPIQIFYGLLLN
jgi:hypothetical protein